MESHNRSVAQALSVYRLRARPQVEAPELVHPRFIGSLDDARVVISADGLADVDWDVASAPQAWILTLPELIYCSGEKWGYQVGMEWTGAGDSWSYRDYPVRDLLDGWSIVDGVHRLDPDFASRAQVHGRLSGSIAPSEIGVRYTLELTNSSRRPWTDVFWWLCLNHYQSRVTGYRPHFRVGSSWAPAQEMRGGRVHSYFPAPGMADEYRTSPNQGFHAPRRSSPIPASSPGTRRSRARCWWPTCRPTRSRSARTRRGRAPISSSGSATCPRARRSRPPGTSWSPGATSGPSRSRPTGWSTCCDGRADGGHPGAADDWPGVLDLLTFSSGRRDSSRSLAEVAAIAPFLSTAPAAFAHVVADRWRRVQEPRAYVLDWSAPYVAKSRPEAG